MRARLHGRFDGAPATDVLTGRPRGPSPLLLTAALAAMLAIGRVAELVGELAVPTPVAEEAGTSTPLEAGNAEPSVEHGAVQPVSATTAPEALLPVPAVEPAAGPAAPLAPGAPHDPLADVAAELAQRAAELDSRERELAVREAAAAAVETRLGAQLARLEGLKKELEELVRKISGQDEAEIAQLVKTYEAMKARSAAQVFDQLALDLLLPIVRRMREAKLAAILAAMEPARAKQLTAALAQQTPLPRLP